MNNKQSVVIHVFLSQHIAVDSGVPQGTVLIMYFIRTRSRPTETATHTIHIYHGTHYYQPCPCIF